MEQLSVDNLLGIKYINRDDINLIFNTADHFKEVLNRPIKKVPSLRDITIANLIRLVCNLTSVEFEEIVTYGPERKGKDLHYRLNCQKSEIELSWESEVPLKEGIGRVVEWISRNKDFLEKEPWNYKHLL